MAENIMQCPGCKKKLKLPANIPEGKRIKCSCGEVITTSSIEAAEQPLPRVKSSNKSAGTSSKKSCPYCGEAIMSQAVKCRHCGEFIEEQKVRKRSASTAGELTAAEYIVAVLFAPVGIFMGLVWSQQGLAKGKAMMQTSGLCTLIVGAVSFMTWYYAFRDTGVVDVSDGIPFATEGESYADIMPYSEEDLEPPSNAGSGFSDMPGELDLDGQPAHIKRAMRANVQIRQGPSMGSGVIIQRDGKSVLILTNRHVIDFVFAESRQGTNVKPEDLPDPQIMFVDKTIQTGDILWVAPDGIDLALLKAECAEDVEPVTWSPTPNSITGENVFAIGNPSGLGWTYTRGVISMVRMQKIASHDVPIIQTDTSISPGNSGGGLYNEKGELIGINTFIVRGGDGLGFAIRIKLLENLKPTMLRFAKVEKADESKESDSDNESNDVGEL